MKNIHLLFLVICLFLVSSCREDQTSIIDDVTTGPDPIVKITASFNGFVQDEDGNAISDAIVKLSGQESVTDDQGYFLISGQVNSNGAHISATKEGYFEAHGNVIPSDVGVGHVQFTLKARNPIGNISAGSASTVTLENGSNIGFSANSFVDNNGNAYNGTVTVYADYLDPSAENFSSVMPGDLLATNLEQESVILQSFGMLNVELEGSNGQALQLSNPATLSVKVPEDRIAIAGDEIPLWYFDTETGLWVEEGSAVLKNGMYEGQVEHFTLWNCDVPFDWVELSGTVIARGPLPNVIIKVTWIENGQMAQTTADDMGNFWGKVPAGVELLVEIIDPCGDVVWSDVIGPLTENEHLNIVLDVNAIETITVSGVLQCDGEIVTDGYVILLLDNGMGGIATVNDQGEFSSEILVCNSTSITLTGIQSDPLEQGDPQSFDIEPIIDAEIISACGNDLVYRAIFDFDNWDDLIINNVVATTEVLDSVGDYYRISFLDDQDVGGSVRYNIDLVNWTGDITNPLWGFSYNWEVFGSPTRLYKIGDGNGAGAENVNVFVDPNDEFLEVTYPNSDIQNTRNGQTDTGTFYILAKIE